MKGQYGAVLGLFQVYCEYMHSIEVEMEQSAQIKSARKELKHVLREYSRLLNQVESKRISRSATPRQEDESTGSDSKESTPMPNKRRQNELADNADEFLIPGAAHHEYFDGLINHIMVDSAKDYERDSEDMSKRRKLEEEESRKVDEEKFVSLYDEILPFIETENAYRLGGITAFPVNDPNGKGDRFLGLRFDIFDRVLSKYTIPHYIILKREIKNDNWYIFKTTLPRYIPLVSISFKWLNSDLLKFASEVRKQLIQTLEKSCVFRNIAKQLTATSSMSSDLDYSKIRFSILKKVEILVFCNMSEVTNVIVTPLQADYPMSNDVKKRLMLLLKGRIDNLEKNFVEALKECDL